MFPAMALGRALVGRGRAVSAGHRPPGCALCRHRAALHRGGGGQPVRQHRRSALAACSSWRAALRNSLMALRRLRPVAAAAFGGYASVPAALAAAAQPGSFAGPRAERGVRPRQSPDGPVRPGRRPELRAPRPTFRPGRDCGRCSPATRRGRNSQAMTASAAVPGRFRVLVLGGSQGARIFSDVLPAASGCCCRPTARTPGPRPAVPARGSRSGSGQLRSTGLCSRSSPASSATCRRGWPRPIW